MSLMTALINIIFGNLPEDFASIVIDIDVEVKALPLEY